MNTWSISVKRVEIKNAMQYICLGSALISRFDILFTQIFGRRHEETNLTATNGNHNDNDLLANDIGKINLNGSSGIKNTSNNKKPQVAINSV
jgi:hypothetical protein